MTKLDIIRMGMRVERINKDTHEEKIEVFKANLLLEKQINLSELDRINKDLEMLEEYKNWLEE